MSGEAKLTGTPFTVSFWLVEDQEESVGRRS
jgi:hypothetical protein